LNIGDGVTVTLTASPAPGDALAAADVTPSDAQFAAVPEPGMLGLLALGVLGVLARRRRE
jgi:hypothetical protein